MDMTASLPLAETPSVPIQLRLTEHLSGNRSIDTLESYLRLTDL